MILIEGTEFSHSIQNAAWTNIVDHYGVHGTKLFETGTQVEIVDSRVEKDIADTIEAVIFQLEDTLKERRGNVALRSMQEDHSP